MDNTSRSRMVAGNPPEGQVEVQENQWVETRTATAAVAGNGAQQVHVECGFTRGFAGMQLIGQAGETCRDGRERVRSALEKLGYRFPALRLVISLTPADLKKDGNQFDLALAVSLSRLLSGKEPVVPVGRYLFAAEVWIGGDLRPVKGIVSIAVMAMARGYDGVVMAADNLAEAHCLAKLGERPLRFLGCRHLSEVLGWLYTGNEPSPVDHAPKVPRREEARPDFRDMVLSDEQRLLAMTIAAGEHSALLYGPPGTGKSMFAERIPSLLPPMKAEEHLQAMMIHSSLHERLDHALLAGRAPYRAPHHQASAAALMGKPQRPGELSLAHGGVLFLDELPEFRRDLLEALREPLEVGCIRVSRAEGGTTWKCRLILLAASNNCPCGWHNSSKRPCVCTMAQIHAYARRISGPIRDRIDLHFNMPEHEQSGAALLAREGGDVDAMRERVRKARLLARDRNHRFGVETNRDLAASDLIAAAGWGQAEFIDAFLGEIPQTSGHRATVRALRVARTLADLEGSAQMQPEHFRQAWRWGDAASSMERGQVPGLS
jgi:magnesium chelatase family protein